MADIGTFLGVEHEGALAQAIVDTVAEPLVVLDSDLRVVTASRSFYLKFHVDRQNTQGQRLYVLGDGQWDIPDLGCGWKKSHRARRDGRGMRSSASFPVWSGARCA